MTVNTSRTIPNLSGREGIHPEVASAITNAYLMIQDLQNGTVALNNQLIGGALGAATIAAGAISGITLYCGGYYQTAPTVTITGDGTGATAKAILAGNRVTGVTIVSGGAGYTHAAVTFTP